DRLAFDDLWHDDPWHDDPCDLSWDTGSWKGASPDDEEDGPGPEAPWPDDDAERWPAENGSGGSGERGPGLDEEDPGPSGGVTPDGGGGPVPPRPRPAGERAEAEPGGADSETAPSPVKSDMDSRPVDAADPLDDTDPDDEPSAMGAFRAPGLIGRSGGLRLLARLATVAGVDARPGILAGWGPVHAELVRTIATSPGARWWYVLANPDGSPAAIGRIRTRPDPATVT